MIRSAGRSKCIIAFASIATDQNPITTPTSSNGALQKIPVPSLWSSHRPMKRPMSVGVTMIQPSTPIWPTKRAVDGSPSVSQRRRRCCRVRRHRSGHWGPSVQARRFWPSRLISEYALPFRPQIAQDMADRFHLQFQAFRPRAPLRLDGFAELRQHDPFKMVEVITRTASRVAIATSLPSSPTHAAAYGPKR